MADDDRSLLPPPFPEGYEHFSGREERTVDDKSRIVLPNGWRPHFAAGARLTELRGALALWTERGWRAMSAKVQAAEGAGRLAKGTTEGLRRDTLSLTVDAQGRLPLPPAYRELVGIGGHGTTVQLVGNGDRITIARLEQQVGLSQAEVSAQLADFID